MFEPLDWIPARAPAATELCGHRVKLRPVDPTADAAGLFASSHPPAGDPAIWTYLPDGPYESAEDLRRGLERMLASGDRLTYAVVPLPGEEPRGSASYLRIKPEHGVIEIGHIWFARAIQRSPTTTEAIFLLARHAFDDLGYRRLEWKCDALNLASRSAAERFGFAFEGVFHHHMVVKGRNRDTAWYAITDDRWPAVRTGFERWLADENFGSGGAQRRRLGDLIAAAGPRG